MSLRVRLNLLLSVLFLLILAVGVLLVIHNARRAVLAETQSTAQLALQLLDVGLAGALDSGEQAEERLRRRLEGLEAARHLQVALVEPGGEVVLGRPSLEPASAPDWFVRMVAVEPIEFRRPLSAHGSRAAEIVVRADPADEIGESWRDARGMLVLVLAFSLGANGLLYVTLGRWLRPMERIVQAMEGIEQGDYRARLPPFDLPELGSLAARFNRMAEQLEQSREQNRRLAQQTLAIQEDERRALARELHDELGQSVSAIKAMAVSIEQARDAGAVAGAAAGIASIAGGMYETVRGIMRRLRPVLLDDFGLVPALEDLIDGWNQRFSDAFCKLRVEGRFDDLSEGLDINLYRIVQECLTNVSRHARATAVQVLLERAADAVVLEVRDDGVGFDAGAALGGLGLLGMRERVEALFGELELDTAPGRGTRVRVRIPVVSSQLPP